MLGWCVSWTDLPLMRTTPQPQLLDTRPVDGEPDWLDARQVRMLVLAVCSVTIWLLGGVNAYAIAFVWRTGARRDRVGPCTARPRRGETQH